MFYVVLRSMFFNFILNVVLSFMLFYILRSMFF